MLHVQTIKQIWYYHGTVCKYMYKYMMQHYFILFSYQTLKIILRFAFMSYCMLAETFTFWSKNFSLTMYSVSISMSFAVNAWLSYFAGVKNDG